MELTALFYFMTLFWDEEDCFVRIWPRILPFFVDTIIGTTLKYTQEFFGYISELLTEHMFQKMLFGFYSFKVLHVANFTMINGKTTILCKNVVLWHGQLNFLWSSKVQILQLVV